MAEVTSTTFDPVASALPELYNEQTTVHHDNPVVAFIIGLSIILLASILNAGGLNLTKLDHVRTSQIPKASRRKDWLRPLWVLGMLLYILSQLIGSTLALQYMRAEYVAPLGSTSLIFNFLFASVLVGTPVTNTDIYGTIIVITGVVGIVLFGSINSGLETELDVTRLKYLWSRGNWLIYFISMSLALSMLYIFVSQLEHVLNTRMDLSSVPFAAQISERRNQPNNGPFRKLRSGIQTFILWIREKLENWTSSKGDKTVAWTLGIGWACCGGGLAGGCLVFAKASVKMVSGSLSHQNTGNQFAHAATIITFIWLGITAVLQIICLNRGLKAYESTLVVPVFYGVYTANGFLNSLVFNDSIDAYKPWILFLIFLSIVVLISGVVLLTHKKPESTVKSAPMISLPRRKLKNDNDDDGDVEAHALRSRTSLEADEREPVWELGDASDDEGDSGDHQLHIQTRNISSKLELATHNGLSVDNEEVHGLLKQDAPVDSQHRRSMSSEETMVRTDEDIPKDPEEYGHWRDGNQV